MLEFLSILGAEVRKNRILPLETARNHSIILRKLPASGLWDLELHQKGSL